MQQNQQTNSEKQPQIEQPQKKAYTAPRLTKQGKVEEITHDVTPGPSHQV